MKFSLCDDDRKQIAYLHKMLIKWSANRPFAIHINEYESAKGFLLDYPDNPCSLLLLDIEIRGINGMEFEKNMANMLSVRMKKACLQRK